MPFLDGPELFLELLRLVRIGQAQLLEGRNVHLPHTGNGHFALPVWQVLQHLDALGKADWQLLVQKLRQLLDARALRDL
eukprot:CAMPEP_0115106622 /NCGR_PEP_ID=MMETSP0227-20121206/36783_1 /TAXON_ID=89957 /ORGANISM="Polarella glacialis, Strain CCMP 1383" /LENGTH=78 /DNA_ID=CAMNT_0002504291 /DNA_START=492 /DNA_END=728 /DNA_ORIENTATION=-